MLLRILALLLLWTGLAVAQPIPDQPLAGTLTGQPFRLQSATFAHSVLLLQSKSGTQVRIWGPWTEVPAGLTFSADASTNVWEAPTIEVVQEQLMKLYDSTSGYTIRLEFAAPVNGLLPTRMSLTLPDGTALAGVVQVQVLP